MIAQQSRLKRTPWFCAACHAIGVSTAQSIEEVEIEHFLATECKGRVLHARLPLFVRPYATCAKCHKLIEGETVPRAGLDAYYLFQFHCHNDSIMVYADKSQCYLHLQLATYSITLTDVFNEEQGSREVYPLTATANALTF